jgi:hypothetical protein
MTKLGFICNFLTKCYHKLDSWRHSQLQELQCQDFRVWVHGVVDRAPVKNAQTIREYLFRKIKMQIHLIKNVHVVKNVARSNRCYDFGNIFAENKYLKMAFSVRNTST